MDGLQSAAGAMRAQRPRLQEAGHVRTVLATFHLRREDDVKALTHGVCRSPAEDSLRNCIPVMDNLKSSASQCNVASHLGAVEAPSGAESPLHARACAHTHTIPYSSSNHA